VPAMKELKVLQSLSKCRGHGPLLRGVNVLNLMAVTQGNEKDFFFARMVYATLNNDLAK